MIKLKITNIKLNVLEPKDYGVCADITITLDDLLCIHDIHVINGEKGLFVAFPNTGNMKKYRGKKRYRDIVHPTTQEFRLELIKDILAFYNEQLSNSDDNK